MKDWDKELFIRVPKDLFDDPTWNNREFTKKEAYLDLYFLAHDSPNNKGAIVEINGYMKKVEVGEVPKGLRFYANRWNWSKKKVSNFFKRLEELGYIEIKGTTPITIVKILGWIPRRKHEETQKKHEGNGSDTPVIQLDNKNNNKINNNKERVSPEIHSLFSLFTGSEDITPTGDIVRVIESALNDQSYEVIKKAIRNYHKSGDSKKPHWFFKSDYLDYINHTKTYNYECPHCEHSIESEIANLWQTCTKCRIGKLEKVKSHSVGV